METLRRVSCLISARALLSACEPKDKPEPIPDPSEATPVPEDTSEPQTELFSRTFVAFSDLTSWPQTDVSPAFKAMKKSCTVIMGRDAEAPVSVDAAYGGTVGDWKPACSVLEKYEDVGELHRFFEDYFFAYEIVTAEPINKLTGYYEPELQVAAEPTESLSEPIPARPDDLIEARLGDFEPEYGNKKIWGQVRNGKLVLYPERADIETLPKNAIAYADPADMFFLQIQGSGRLTFPDGRVMRAGFDAHNHRPFGSLANHLIQKGEIERSEASMQGIRAWMEKVGPERAREAMNINPRFVFFRASDIEDPEEGPQGAAGLPLTPMGSLAVDLQHHPLGVPFFIETEIPNAGANWQGEETSLLLISQDTGGAIKGVKRGDIFFGWGDEAGTRAGRMNYPGRFIVFLPQELAESDEAS